MAKSGLELLTLKTVHVLDDGELETDFDEQLRMLVKDAIARPGIRKCRKLQLTVEVTPIAKPDGSCDDVAVECFTTSKMPNRPIEAYRMRATANGGLRFAPTSPDNPDQQSLGFKE